MTLLEDQLQAKPVRRFGTFGGVFTPTLLTILGVIMYLRLGWVIGNAGILGGLLVILLAYGITICTGLAMSSITSNIRLGAGGAYAIISQSLGLEVGGSLGIPRYLSQALAITLYIFGFREAWLWVFPAQPAFMVDLIVFACLWGIAYKSAHLAIRVQYLIMVVIGISLVSIAVAAFSGSMVNPVHGSGLWGSFRGAPETGFSGTSFWIVFAVFFPAATGIMAGANMSGELRDPRRSIPVGTMAAIGVSLVVYLFLGYWIARSATPDELVGNYYVIIDKAAWGPAVLAGVFGATFSSALASMVGSARILQAMGQHRVMPKSDWIGTLTRKGEPRNSMLITGAIVMLTLLMRDLNAIAPLITMFFLVTYAMLNLVVVIEQSLGLVSFRPLFRVHRIVPVLGLIGSVFAMFIINPVISLVAVTLVVIFYGVLARRRLDAPFEDVRSGLFVAFSEWAAKKAANMPSLQQRAWKPNLLIPVVDLEELRGSFTIIEDIAFPKGAVKLLGINPGTPGFVNKLKRLGQAFRERGVFSLTMVVENTPYTTGVITGMQVLHGTFFRPNIVLLNKPADAQRTKAYGSVLGRASELGLGVLIHAPHLVAGHGQRRSINVWIRDRSPDWQLRWDVGNLDLAILIAYKLARNWKAQMRIITVIRNEQDRPDAHRFMSRLVDLARIPDTEVVVAVNDFISYVSTAPQADLSVFGLGPDPDLSFVGAMVERTGSTCLFVRDSGRESVLA